VLIDAPQDEIYHLLLSSLIMCMCFLLLLSCRFLGVDFWTGMCGVMFLLLLSCRSRQDGDRYHRGTDEVESSSAGCRLLCCVYGQRWVKVAAGARNHWFGAAHLARL
jgi:hypothetical protein